MLRALTADRGSGLVCAKPLETGLPENAFLRPLGEPYFRNERRRNPMSALGVIAPGRIYKRRRALLHPDKGAVKLLEEAVGESGPDLSGISQLPVFVKAHEQCAESLSRSRGLRIAADDEFLPLLAFHFEPAAASARPVPRIDAFDDQA